MRKLLFLSILVLVGAAAFHYFPRRPQNLILITIDTLRADHLSLYGYQRLTSPNLDRRAKKAVVFEKALVQWPKTVPSMVSLFTSTYPHTNGVLFGSRGQYVNDELITLTEVLRNQGFATYGIVSNAVLSDATNFSQGFEVYKETWLDDSRGKEHSRADHVTDLALEALKSLQNKNFFLWIHYVDPHYQYRPPAPFHEMFVEDRFYRKGRILKKNPEENNYYGGIAGRIWTLDQNQEWDYYIAQYDAEIRFLDHHLQRLFAKLDYLNLWEKSLVCFTADHGESLGENHYFFEHGWFPYTSCSHVPLLIWDPNAKPKRIPDSVALVDLAPTLLQKMKLPVPKSFEGKPWNFQEPPRPVYIDSGEGGLNHTNYIRSLWIWPYHLVYVPNPQYQNMMQHSLFELYNVQQDWYEKRNLLAREPQKAEELKQHLLRWVRSTGKAASNPKKKPEYNPEDIEQMEALGYVQ